MLIVEHTRRELYERVVINKFGLWFGNLIRFGSQNLGTSNKESEESQN